MASKHDFRHGTKQFMIAEICERGLTRRQAFNELRPLVENQIRPMIFSANVHGRRQAKPLHEQYRELRNSISRVYAKLGRLDNDREFDRDDFNGDEFEQEIPETPETPEETPETPDEIVDEEIDEDDEEKVIARAKLRIRNEMERFRNEVRRIRKFCQDRAMNGDYIDAISMRPALAAAKLIPAGIPCDALLAAMCMHWDDDAKRQAAIPSFDFAAFSRKIMNERGIPLSEYHELFGYALILAENRIPIMLVGPAGSGKSYIARQIADYLELSYGETPMSPGATRGDLLGRHTIGGFVMAQCSGIYGSGGVFNFEEIDASDPAMLIVLNNALAGDQLFNSANGEIYDKHEDFVAVSTANTFGTGATREFTARERLDSATLDRWRMGRIYVPIDETVEDSILGL